MKNGVNPAQAAEIARNALAGAGANPEMMQALVQQVAETCQRVNDLQVIEQMAATIFAGYAAGLGVVGVEERGNLHAQAAVDAITVFANVRVFVKQEQLATKLVNLVAAREKAVSEARVAAQVTAEGEVVGSIGGADPGAPQAEPIEPVAEGAVKCGLCGEVVVGRHRCAVLTEEHRPTPAVGEEPAVIPPGSS